MKILAADDQPIILKSLKLKLEQGGFEVFGASDGNEALKVFDEEMPNLAILDLNMPEKSGFDVIKYIREVAKSSIPIIIMSGNDDEKTILEAFNLGADDYIEKPVGLNEVAVRVRRLLKMPIMASSNLEGQNSNSGIIQKNGIGVVIPCYNEESRLKTAEFSNFVKNNHGYLLCFVNDGSKDNTLNVLKDFEKQNNGSVVVYDCEKNGGKAEAVRLGILHLLKDKSLDYIGFLDADLSTNFDDFEDLAKTISGSNYKLVAGSRISRMGANIIKQSSRGIISKTINFIIRKILGMEFQDTQCGAKIMTRDVAENLFNQPFYTRWIFDVEIFLRMKKHFGADKVQSLISEQPLKRWVHEDGSKLSMKDSFKIIGQLYTIYSKY
ncbi:response regulator [Lacihabitans soyangensis]|uniref:dolichyl-phosphate beta-glucosyltransferase n=1 Tax=Lacihabitans soyangensis TaxID=869394 RepID=A0AAE3H6E0_9BACT|nr:response regulator [Lacihabitans soyangensis]MCP9763845.1 response regulator [Lacihabitans soyangensis]